MRELGSEAFDFWVGTWDCEWHGLSHSVFHPQLGIWQQTWVDQGGAYWHFVGDLVDGDPSFGTPTPVDEPTLWKRMVFTDIAADSFRWRWESSPDRQDWTENWAISYTRRS